jgi:hypothetical protein
MIILQAATKIGITVKSNYKQKLFQALLQRLSNAIDLAMVGDMPSMIDGPRPGDRRQKYR